MRFARNLCVPSYAGEEDKGAPDRSIGYFYEQM